MIDTQLIVSALEKLATKLGVTAEHLWGVLVYQQIIEARYAIIASFVFWSLFLFAIRKTIKDSTYFQNPSSAKDIFGIVFFILIAICTLISSISFLATITGLFNPEYQALKALMEMIRR